MICKYDSMEGSSCICCTAIVCMYLVKHFTHSTRVVISGLTNFLVNPPSTTDQLSPERISLSLGRKRVRSQYFPSHMFFLNWGASCSCTYSAVSTDWGILLFQNDLPSSPQSSSSSDSSLCFLLVPCFSPLQLHYHPLQLPRSWNWGSAVPFAAHLSPLVLFHPAWLLGWP